MVASESGDVLIISKTAVVIGPIEVVGIKQTNKASDAYPPPESYVCAMSHPLSNNVVFAYRFVCISFIFDLFVTLYTKM